MSAPPADGGSSSRSATRIRSSRAARRSSRRTRSVSETSPTRRRIRARYVARSRAVWWPSAASRSTMSGFASMIAPSAGVGGRRGASRWRTAASPDEAEMTAAPRGPSRVAHRSRSRSPGASRPVAWREAEQDRGGVNGGSAGPDRRFIATRRPPRALAASLSDPMLAGCDCSASRIFTATPTRSRRSWPRPSAEATPSSWSPEISAFPARSRSRRGAGSPRPRRFAYKAYRDRAPGDAGPRQGAGRGANTSERGSIACPRRAPSSAS